MSFWEKLFGSKTATAKAPPADRVPIPRGGDEGKKLKTFPEEDRCCVLFLFDYDLLGGAYGQAIFQTMWGVLKHKIGLCVFADGDLPMSDGKDMAYDVTFVPTYARGPLARFASGNYDSLHPYAIAVYQEDHYTRDVHLKLMQEFGPAYLGCLLRRQTVYSLGEFEQLVDDWGLVSSMEFHGGQIVRNGHAITA